MDSEKKPEGISRLNENEGGVKPGIFKRTTIMMARAGDRFHWLQTRKVPGFETSENF